MEEMACSSSYPFAQPLRKTGHPLGASLALRAFHAAFSHLSLTSAGAPRARACCACDFGWCSCQEPLQTGWPAGGVPCRHRQTTVTGALSNCGRFAVARTERTAKRLACWLPRPPAEQPARHVRWPTCPSLRYEQRVGLQAGDKLLCCRPQKNGEAKQGSLPAAEAPAAQERGLSAPARSRFPLPVAVRSAARAARSTAVSRARRSSGASQGMDHNPPRMSLP